MKTLQRYLVREVLAAWAAVTVILLLILMASYVGRYLGAIAAGDLPSNLFFQVLGLKTVGSLGLLLPASLFIGAMLALGRLHRDSEVVVMSATGAGPGRFYRALSWIGVPAFFLLALLSLWLAPLAAATSERLQEEAARTARLATLQPGQFQPLSDGRVIYAGDLGDEGVMRNIMIFAPKGAGVNLLSARRGYTYTGSNGNARYLVLEDGKSAAGVPGQADFSLLSFERSVLRVPRDSGADTRLDMEAQPTLKLLQTDSQWYKAELHWRLASPISILILLVLVLPASRLGPRESRYGKLALGFLIYLVYANLLGLGRAWIEQEQIPAWLGLWWVHGLLLVAGTWWLWLQHRRVKREPA